MKLAIVIDGDSKYHEARSIFVFRSASFDTAFPRALELGHGLDAEYENFEGKRVRWLLSEVETLDLLGDEITDGREVYSESLSYVPLEGTLPSFAPEKSDPTGTGV